MSKRLLFFIVMAVAEAKEAKDYGLRGRRKSSGGGVSPSSMGRIYGRAACLATRGFTIPFPVYEHNPTGGQMAEARPVSRFGIIR